MLYLLRHAEAAPDASHDHDRQLTEKGEGQCKRVAAFLVDHRIAPELIMASPVVRARQTAEQVCRRAGLPEPLIQPWLACGMSPSDAFEELAAFLPRFESILLVGHEPDLSGFIGAAIGLHDPEGIHIRKGSLTGLSHGRLTPGSATLEFSLPVRWMSA